MDLIFQTLTSLYTRSNSPVVVRSDFSHTSFLPGFQKTGVWGGGDVGWAALLSFSGCFKLWLSQELSGGHAGTKARLGHMDHWWPSLLPPPAHQDVFHKTAWKRGWQAATAPFLHGAGTQVRGVLGSVCAPCNASSQPHSIAIFQDHTGGKQHQA